MSSILPYIGGKNRLAKHILPHLARPGIDCLVDVFGGSGAVTIACGEKFHKRVYNEVSGDLINFFRVLRTPELRRAMFILLRNTPAARHVFQDYHRTWLKNGFTFSGIADPVDRAVATFYRHHYSFGGKVLNGGFSVSTGDRHGIKEIVRYRNTLKNLAHAASFWRDTLIENLDALELVKVYGGRENVVLFCDPPYDGTEAYYTELFTPFHKVTLPVLLADCKAHVVLTFYETPFLHENYPPERWQWNFVQASKNASFRGGQRSITEVILVKR